MVRTKENQYVNHMCIRGGNGEAELHVILGEDELYGKGRLFNHMVLAPGCSVGEHVHAGDNEVYYILKGTGTYNDNGKKLKVGPGDTTVCNDGELHGLVNDGDEDLELIALILF